MRKTAGYWMIAVVMSLGGLAPSTATAASDSVLAQQCAQASGFAARAARHPNYSTGNVYATQQELDYMNRCVAAGTTTTSTSVPTYRNGHRVRARETRLERGNLPLPTQYPLMRGDDALWRGMSTAQQHRAMLFLHTGSTIRSSLHRD